MLYMMGGGRIQRVHGPFVTDHEVEEVVRHLKTQGTPEYLDSITADDEIDADNYEQIAGQSGEESNDLYDKAVAIVLRDRKASTSYIQRRHGDRLQPRRIADRAHGEGRPPRSRQPRGKTGNPGRRGRGRAVPVEWRRRDLAQAVPGAANSP